MQKTLNESKTVVSVQPFAESFEAILSRFGGLATKVGKTTMNPEVLNAFANASMFLDAGDFVMIWMLLRQTTLVANKLSNGAKKKEAAFLEDQLKPPQYFSETILSITHGRIAALMKPCGAAIEISDESFGGK